MSYRIDAVVLAAGESTRAGEKNKLLLRFHTKTLISHAVDSAIGSTAHTVHVVTGHEPDELKAALEGRSVQFIHNSRFKTGIGSSIVCAINTLLGQVDGVIICLADMPRVQSHHLDALINQFTGKTVCTFYYGSRQGHPILFPENWFDRLRNLKGDCGARSLLVKSPHEITAIPSVDDAVLYDIDQLEDLPEP